MALAAGLGRRAQETARRLQRPAPAPRPAVLIAFPVALALRLAISTTGGACGSTATSALSIAARSAPAAVTRGRRHCVVFRSGEALERFQCFGGAIRERSPWKRLGSMLGSYDASFDPPCPRGGMRGKRGPRGEMLLRLSPAFRVSPYLGERRGRRLAWPAPRRPSMLPVAQRARQSRHDERVQRPRPDQGAHLPQEDVVTVVPHDTLTKGERSVVSDGLDELV